MAACPGALHWLLSCAVLVALASSDAPSCDTALYSPQMVALIMRLTNEGAPMIPKWHGIACSALLALEHANNGNSSIVPELAGGNDPPVLSQLHDSGSVPRYGVDAYREAERTGTAAIVGPARSAVSLPLGYLGAVDGMPLVSYWSSSPSLAEQKNFPTFQRTYISDADAAGSMMAMVRHFGWLHFSLLYVADVYASGYAEAINTRATECNMSVDNVAVFEYNKRESVVRRATLSSHRLLSPRPPYAPPPPLTLLPPPPARSAPCESSARRG